MIFTFIALWPLLGIAAWIFMLWAVNRRYTVPVDNWFMFCLMLLFIFLGPLAWFPACVIKALNETE